MVSRLCDDRAHAPLIARRLIFRHSATGLLPVGFEIRYDASMFFTELFFEAKVLRYLLKEVLGFIGFVAVLVVLALQGTWWPLAAFLAGGLLIGALIKGVTRLIMRNAPPQYTAEQVCARAQTIHEMAQGNTWFDPSTVPYPPAAKAPAKTAPTPVRSMTMLEVCELESQRRLLRP
jgi:hypothetical protein